MNGNPSVQPANGDATPEVHWGKAALRFALYLLLTPVVLFLAAGRLDWGWAWGYVGLALAATAISRVIAWRRHPELLAERARSLEAPDAKSWDQVLIPLVVGIGPLAMLIVAGLDVRYGWSAAFPQGVQIAGTVVLALGWAFATWAFVANRFFSAVVRIQKDREHSVVTDGPYRFVRHPGYAGGILSTLVSPLMLGSWWALIPAALMAAATVVRTALEDRTLLDELPGYADYAQQTRYRLLPGVW